MQSRALAEEEKRVYETRRTSWEALAREARAPARIFALFCAALQNIDFRIKTETSTKTIIDCNKKHPALDPI